MENSQQDFYRTKDVMESSFLLARGRKLLRVEREGSMCWLFFAGRVECESLVNDYWLGNSSVQAKIFVDALNRVRNLIFSRK